MSWADFIHMGGYAPYVFSAYVALNLIPPLRARHRRLRQLARAAQRRDRAP
jgi:heme exporter protein D